jgi:hypothetical protein
MTDFEELLRRLLEAKVELIVAGGVAAIAHGSSRLTQDLDIVYSRTPENLDRLAAALEPLEPYLRGAPPGLPFRLDPATLKRGLNFTLTTSRGDLDLLGEVTGGGRYEDLVRESVELRVFGFGCRFLDLGALIRTKRSAGRPKDLEAIAELEALFEERGSSHR